LHGIYYLRTISDAEAIKRATSYSRKAVVVGSGFIGMELASAFRREGIQTTIISKGENIFEGLDSQEISTFFESYYKKQGVEIVLGDTLKEFQGTHHVNGVLTTKGMFMPCDIVAVGIGVTPDTGFLETSGILLNDGIVVDEYMQTNYNEIFAAGDVTRFYDTVFGQYRRVEHWDNAAKQGKIAAKNMLGRKEYYNEVSYFFSDVFDLSFGFLGYTKDTNERIIRGSLTDQSFTVYYLRDGILSGAFLLNRPNSEEEVARNLIQNHANLENNKAELPEITLQLDKVAGGTAH
jgi:NTE family protein